jgi:hypothetical protein
MANPEENKGAFYQYYWIKVSTEEQLARFRSQMLQPGGATSLSGNDPNYPIHPPLKRYKAVESSYHPQYPISPPLRVLTQEVSEPKEKEMPRPDKGLPPAQLTLGFVLTAAYANAKGMFLERHEMPRGISLEEAQKWIESDEGKRWAGEAFCVLAYIGSAED